MDYTSLIKEVDIPELVEALRFCARWHRADDALANAEQAAAAIEALQAHLPKRGEFVYVRGDGMTCCDGWKCSACGKTYHTNVPYFGEYNFCPNCGAKMEVQDESAGSM